MYKIFSLFAVSFIFLTVSDAQKLSVAVNYITSEGAVNNNNIYYQPGYLLTWSDFKGKPVEGSDVAALTNAGFGIKLSFHRIENTSQLVIAVNCNFSKKDSWVKKENKTTYILNHEQKHFDIAYIHTLSFMQNLKNAKLTNSNYAAIIEKIYNESVAAMSKMQNQYDIETSHSRLTEIQSAWDEKISNQLLLSVKE
jgi:hypothetical protein